MDWLTPELIGALRRAVLKLSTAVVGVTSLAFVSLGAMVAGGIVLEGCGTTAGHTLVVLGCKSQCPIALGLALDACHGKLDQQVTEKPGDALYAVCVEEAGLVRAACPGLCDLIPAVELDGVPE